MTEQNDTLIFKQKQMPPVSAYIPCFNNEKSVVDTIQSIRAQSVTVQQLFVIDDG